MGNRLEIHHHQPTLLDEAVVAIEKDGFFKRDLTNLELAEIIPLIVRHLLPVAPSIAMSTPRVKVVIEQGVATINYEVDLHKPGRALIKLHWKIAKSDRFPGKIKTLPGWEITDDAGLVTSMALRAFNIQGKAASALRDPNKTIGDVLAAELHSRKINLTGIEMHFNQETLGITLTGEK